MNPFNWLDYVLLGLFIFQWGLLWLPPTSRASTKVMNALFWPSCGVVLYAFCRWQYHVGAVSSTIVENAQCEDEVKYYVTLRNGYLDLCLLMVTAGAIWVGSLKAKLHEQEAHTD
mmetsp:Transcript_69414/g.193164  ORF Transcript_69414/g.193164 Transcript_69414/m.193164 type:complete len:115 (+) Transcript_69414:106-450(+)